MKDHEAGLKLDSDAAKSGIAIEDAKHADAASFLQMFKNAQNEEGSCASEWSQCGGSEWTGLTNCCSGLKCNKQNVWYSQCIKDEAAQDAQAPCRKHWEQCGGAGWTGATCCVSPYICEKINENWSHCIEKASEAVEGKKPEDLKDDMDVSRCAIEKELCSAFSDSKTAKARSFAGTCTIPVSPRIWRLINICNAWKYNRSIQLYCVLINKLRT